MSSAKELVIGTLHTDAFTMVNKKVLRYLKGDGTLAIVICELVGLYTYMLQSGAVDDLESFALPIQFLDRSMNLSTYKQQHALDRLQAAGLVHVSRVGMPASRRVALNFDSIASILQNDQLSSKAEESAVFYKAMTATANSTPFDALAFAATLDRIKNPLRDCMILLTKKARDSGVPVEWTGGRVFQLRGIVSHYTKQANNFDFVRFSNLVDAALGQSGVNDLFTTMNGIYKAVAEVALNDRKYSIGEMI
jgi:hypothetical protein